MKTFKKNLEIITNFEQDEQEVKKVQNEGYKQLQLKLQSTNHICHILNSAVQRLQQQILHIFKLQIPLKSYRIERTDRSAEKMDRNDRFYRNQKSDRNDRKFINTDILRTANYIESVYTKTNPISIKSSQLSRNQRMRSQSQIYRHRNSHQQNGQNLQMDEYILKRNRSYRNIQHQSVQNSRANILEQIVQKLQRNKNSRYHFEDNKSQDQVLKRISRLQKMIRGIRSQTQNQSHVVKTFKNTHQQDQEFVYQKSNNHKVKKFKEHNEDNDLLFKQFLKEIQIIKKQVRQIKINNEQILKSEQQRSRLSLSSEPAKGTLHPHFCFVSHHDKNGDYSFKGDLNGKNSKISQRNLQTTFQPNLRINQQQILPSQSQVYNKNVSITDNQRVWQNNHPSPNQFPNVRTVSQSVRPIQVRFNPPILNQSQIRPGPPVIIRQVPLPPNPQITPLPSNFVRNQQNVNGKVICPYCNRGCNCPIMQNQRTQIQTQGPVYL